MEVGDAARPVGVYFRHIHPGNESFCERVQKSVRGFIDLGYPKNVVDIRYNGKTSGGNEVGSCVSCVCAISVNTKSLDLCCAISWQQVTTWPRNVGNLDELVKVSFNSGFSNHSYILCSSSVCRVGVNACLAIEATDSNRLEVERDVDIPLLYDVYFGCQVTGLGLLGRWEGLNRRANEEEICQIIEFRFGDVRLFEDIAMETEVPATVGPVGIAPKFESIESPMKTSVSLRDVQNLSRRSC